MQNAVSKPEHRLALGENYARLTALNETAPGTDATPMKNALEAIITENPERDLFVVGHGIRNRDFLRLIGDREYGLMGNGNLYELTFDKGDWRVGFYCSFM